MRHCVEQVGKPRKRVQGKLKQHRRALMIVTTTTISVWEKELWVFTLAAIVPRLSLLPNHARTSLSSRE